MPEEYQPLKPIVKNTSSKHIEIIWVIEIRYKHEATRTVDHEKRQKDSAHSRHAMMSHHGNQKTENQTRETYIHTQGATCQSTLCASYGRDADAFETHGTTQLGAKSATDASF